MAHKSILGPRGKTASRAVIDDATQRAFQQSQLGVAGTRPAVQKACLLAQGRPDQLQTNVDNYLNVYSPT